MELSKQISRLVPFCTAAISAMRDRQTAEFICPLCGAVAHSERVQARLRAWCEGCGGRIEE